MPRKLDYNARITQRIEIAPGLIILRITPDGELFPFLPGQYTVLGLRRGEPRCEGSEPESDELRQRDSDEMIRRAYSIASSSLERHHIDIYLALVTSGELTPRLFNLKIGDRLFVGPKATGMFTLDCVAPHKHVCLAATGTGLAPYISMVRTQLTENPERRFSIAHGARYSWDLGYRDELITLDRFWSNLTYAPIISRKQSDPDWQGRVGYVQTVLEEWLQEGEGREPMRPETHDVFLCGNPGMIEQAAELLERHGFKKDERKDPGTIHIEEYW
ncbi:MAG: hypothetical protein GC154_09815 [bacterium]|nr:hypothetical protein [bacterium]